MLTAHPQTYLPPFQEIRLFGEGKVAPWHILLNVLFSRHWHSAIMRRNLARNLRGLGSPRRWNKSRDDNPWWFFGFCFGHRS